MPLYILYKYKRKDAILSRKGYVLKSLPIPAPYSFDSMNLPAITQKQKEILLHLYKFRFLTTNQIQLLLHHKNPTRIQPWLKNLTEKEYVRRYYSRTTFGDNTKPAIYFLASRARHILKEEKDCSSHELNRVYKEKQKSKKFIDHNLFIADIYLYFLSRKEAHEELHFFPRANLGDFEHFPNPLPDAYIAVKTPEKTKRYFLDLFDAYTPPFVLRNRVKAYFSYAENTTWQENTNNSLLPTILFVCPSETTKKHIFMYSKALLTKTFEEITFFLTTKDNIQNGMTQKNIWEKVA